LWPVTQNISASKNNLDEELPSEKTGGIEIDGRETRKNPDAP